MSSFNPNIGSEVPAEGDIAEPVIVDASTPEYAEVAGGRGFFQDGNSPTGWSFSNGEGQVAVGVDEPVDDSLLLGAPSNAPSEAAVSPSNGLVAQSGGVGAPPPPPPPQGVTGGDPISGIIGSMPPEMQAMLQEEMAGQQEKSVEKQQKGVIKDLAKALNGLMGNGA